MIAVNFTEFRTKLKSYLFEKCLGGLCFVAKYDLSGELSDPGCAIN